MREGVIGALIKALDTWVADGEIQAQGLHTLGMFAFEQTTVEAILDGNGVATAINAAAAHATNASVQQEAM